MLFSRKRKIFCIGMNKTGTTSVEASLKSLGFRLGDQARTELLLEDWGRRDFRRLVRVCRSADAFQDVPFSLPDTYRTLDEAFPRSRFILTVRDSSPQWYESLARFHTKIVGKGRLPTPQDLRNYPGGYGGWLWRYHELVYGIDESTLFDRDIYISRYEEHNQGVEDYFASRPADLLVLNVADSSSMHKLCEFLGLQHTGQQMSHLNTSR